MGEILDGKKLARELGEKLGSEVASLKEHGVSPKLCVINIGDDQASKVYVASKKLKAEKQFAMAPITIITIDNANYSGWAFI